jgi:glutamate---cysteine ligase / carboxylate-amine ligase
MNGFGATAPYTVGVEEEFQLVDPVSRGLTPAVDGVLAAGNGTKLITSELSRSCVEMLSPVFGTAAELARELPGLRREVRDLARSRGVEIVAAGAHPFSEPTEQPLTAGGHNLRVEEEMGWVARTQAIYGLHVHVAVPDGEAAVRAVGVLSRHVPLFLALSANSPFWNGADTRLASTRAKVFALVPRSGLPPAFHGWEEFEAYVDALVDAGLIPDYSWCWWDVRPHPRLGTVELRAPDVQTDPDRTSALAALAQCLVATADEHPPEDPLFTEENKWSATRHGLDATLRDFSTGHATPARRLARTLAESLAPVSQDLGCEAELEGIVEVTEAGNGAQHQRRVYNRRGSLEDVVRYLVEATCGG